jgi:hypothetical protein
VAAAPEGNDASAKGATPAAEPARPLEKTPAAALSTPTETVTPAPSKTASDTSSNETRSPWRLSLSGIEAFADDSPESTEGRVAGQRIGHGTVSNSVSDVGP